MVPRITGLALWLTPQQSTPARSATDQLAAFQAGDEESLRLIALPTQYAIGFISKGLLGIYQVFSKFVPPMQENVRDIVETWAGIVENGISRASAK